MIMAPNVGQHRCGNCKFQVQLPYLFGEAKLCRRYPFTVHVVPDVSRGVPAGVKMQTTDGRVIDMPGGGSQLLFMKNEIRLPPADDELPACGEWKPRFLATDGSRL